MRAYDTLLHWALAHRLITVIVGVVFFIGSIALFRTLPTSVIGNVDRNETLLTVELPPVVAYEPDGIPILEPTKIEASSLSKVNSVGRPIILPELVAANISARAEIPGIVCPPIFTVPVTSPT